MGGYNLYVYGYITTCIVLVAFITGYYITVITDVLKDYEPDERHERLFNWMHAGAVIYIILGLWRLLVQIALIIYFGKMGKRFFKRLSDEVGAWFW